MPRVVSNSDGSDRFRGTLDDYDAYSFIRNLVQLQRLPDTDQLWRYNNYPYPQSDTTNSPQDFNVNPYSLSDLFDERPTSAILRDFREETAGLAGRALPDVSRLLPRNNQDSRMASAALGAAAISGGSNIIGSTVGGLFGLLGQKDRLRVQLEQQRNDQNFQRQMAEVMLQNSMAMSRLGVANQKELYTFDNQMKVNALSKAGLPDYLAAMPGQVAAMPLMSQRMPGGRMYTSRLMGDPRTTPFMGNEIQSNMGWGKLPGSIFG